MEDQRPLGLAHSQTRVIFRLDSGAASSAHAGHSKERQRTRGGDGGDGPSGHENVSRDLFPSSRIETSQLPKASPQEQVQHQVVRAERSEIQFTNESP